MEIDAGYGEPTPAKEATMAPPIFVQFRLTTSLAYGHFVMVERRRLWQVPSVNAVVNIKNNPFRVYKVSWSIPEDEYGEYTQYAYVDVIKACEFRLCINGKEY